MPDSCPLYAGRRPSSLQAPDGLIPVVWTAPGFDDTYGYRRVLEGLLSLSFRTPTCPESCPGLSFRRYTTTALYRSSSDRFETRS